MNTKALTILEVVGMPIGSTVQSLVPGTTVTLRGDRASSLYCVSGALWVTWEGSREDLIVSAGETREIGGRGRIVISAFEDSRLWIA